MKNLKSGYSGLTEELFNSYTKEELVEILVKITEVDRWVCMGNTQPSLPEDEIADIMRKRT